MPIVGDPASFAVEFGITTHLDNSNQLATGYLAYWVSGRLFGLRDEEATLLGSSYRAISDRVHGAGLHRSRFSATPRDSLVSTYLWSIFGAADAINMSLSDSDFEDDIRSADIVMAPDGDAAFDDGSHILQFDLDDVVRIVAFKNLGDFSTIVAEAIDLDIEVVQFYGVLSDTLLLIDHMLAAMRTSH